VISRELVRNVLFIGDEICEMGVGEGWSEETWTKREKTKERERDRERENKCAHVAACAGVERGGRECRCDACVAVRCSALQCVGVRWSALRCVAVRCGAL